MKVIFFLFFISAFAAKAQTNDGAKTPMSVTTKTGLDTLDTPPPDEIFVAAKIDPKSYTKAFALEGGWGFSNPFANDYTLGLGAYYLPTTYFRSGLIVNRHWSSKTSLAERIDDHISIRDEKVHLTVPEWDILGHFEIRALHGLVRLFSDKTLDYESGIFMRLGRRLSSSPREWSWVWEPGLSQTILFSNLINLRIQLSTDLRSDNHSLVLQSVYLRLGLEFRP